MSRNVLKTKNHTLPSRPKNLLVLAISLIGAAQAQAVQFDMGPVEGSVASQLSFGTSWRADKQNDLLYTAGNREGGKASTSVTDDGNLNYDQGDMFSMILKGRHDLSLNWNDLGMFGRLRYWYDYVGDQQDLGHGNSLNNYDDNKPLEDGDFSSLAKSSGAEVMDLYAYYSFDLGPMPVDFRLGRQVVSWGESTFIQNSVNIINPVDVSALRKPGAELKDALLPVNMVYTAIGLTNDLSMEAFYQLEWKPVEVDGCGTYFASADLAAEGCNKLTTYSSSQPLSDKELVALGPKVQTGYDNLTQVYTYDGGYVQRGSDVEASDEGQYGVALRYYAEWAGATEFGLYYINYHERLPIFSVVTGINPRYFFEYPEDTKVYGFSFSTNLGSWSVSGELSHRPDMPMQINTTEMVQPLVEPSSKWSTMYEEIAYIDDPDTPQIEGTPSGTVVHGYDNFGFTQAQFTFLQFVDRILGASRMTFLTEVGFNWINGLPDRSERRYGRSPVYGMGDFAGFTETRDINVGPISAEAEVSYSCESVVLSSDNSIIDGAAGGEVGKPNINPKNCTDEGYYTDFSWGIRSLIALDYNNVFNGINLRPIVVYQKDIEGYAPTPNFNEGTLVMSYKLDATYLNRYTANISYTDYKGGRYNQSVDRDFVAVSVGVSF